MAYFRTVLAPAAAAALLAACAPAPVKDIAADKLGYMKTNFSPAMLSSDMKKQLAAHDHAPAAFNTLRLKIKVMLEELDKKPQTPTVNLTLHNAGEGLVQEMKEYFNNGLAYGMHYSLNYAGLLPLRQQNVRYSFRQSGLIYEAKQIKALSRNLARPEPDSDYELAWTSGSSAQFANFSEISINCHSGQPYAASKLHPRLSGSAIDLNCTRSVDGVERTRESYSVLKDYGVALKTGYQSSNAKESYIIEEVEAL
jgi:hypothetical protein